MKATIKIYESYFLSKKNKLYYNEIKELSGLSDSSLTRGLKKLVEKKTLNIEKTKSNTFYEIKNKKLFALKFSELALNKFDNLNTNTKIPLKNFLKEIPKEIFTIILFGSTAKKEETKNSDIDLLIISRTKINLDKNKKEAEITSKYPLSIFQTTIDQFIKNKDDIIIQARKTGFPIQREQNFYEVILNEYR